MSYLSAIWKQGGLMCGIWDWQSTIVMDLNDCQDPKHTLFCCENAFVAIYALFSDNKCLLFTRLGGGVAQSGHCLCSVSLMFLCFSLIFCIRYLSWILCILDILVSRYFLSGFWLNSPIFSPSVNITQRKVYLRIFSLFLCRCRSLYQLQDISKSLVKKNESVKYWYPAWWCWKK